MKKGHAKKAVEPQPEAPKVDRFTNSPPNIKAIGGSGLFIWDMMVVERVSMAMFPTEVNGADERKLLAATAIRAFEPKDAVEAMMASQAALHFASLECSRRSVLPNQQADVASKLRRDAANSARAMVEMCEGIDRRRGKGPQVVRVERVVVNEGGQAVVGNVQAGAPLPPPASAPQAFGQAVDPMPMVEAVPVPVAEGEGAPPDRRRRPGSHDGVPPSQSTAVGPAR